MKIYYEVTSGEYPDKFKIKRPNTNGYDVRLRTNISQIDDTLEDGTASTHYQYDEIEIEVPVKHGVDEFVNNNFDGLLQNYDPRIANNSLEELKKENADLWYELMKVV